MTPFCPELQQPWHVERIITKGLTEFTLHLATSYELPRPDVVGRNISDVIAEPQIYITTRKAAFAFSECISIHICDEEHLPVDLEGTSTGGTFCRITGSPASTAIQDGRAPDMRTPLHYRIVTQDTVFDIICDAAPVITLSPKIDTSTPVA